MRYEQMINTAEEWLSEFQTPSINSLLIQTVIVVYLSLKVFKVVSLFVLQVKKIKTDLQKAATIPVSQISRIAGQENTKTPIQLKCILP